MRRHKVKWYRRKHSVTGGYTDGWKCRCGVLGCVLVDAEDHLRYVRQVKALNGPKRWKTWGWNTDDVVLVCCALAAFGLWLGLVILQ